MMSSIRSFPLQEHATVAESSDRPLLDLIRRHGPLTVAEMAALLG